MKKYLLPIHRKRYLSFLPLILTLLVMTPSPTHAQDYPIYPLEPEVPQMNQEVVEFKDTLRYQDLEVGKTYLVHVLFLADPEGDGHWRKLQLGDGRIIEDYVTLTPTKKDGTQEIVIQLSKSSVEQLQKVTDKVRFFYQLYEESSKQLSSAVGQEG